MNLIHREVKRITVFINDISISLGTNGCALGISGGVDSAVCAALACRALGSDNCLGIIIPAVDSDPQDEVDAKEIAGMLDIEYTVHPLDLSQFMFKKIDFDKEVKPLLLTMDSLLPPEVELPYIMKLRGRMFIVTYYARKNNYLQCETLEKTEWMLGWHDKFGDGAGDIAPIRHLYKSQVYDLARYFVKCGELPEPVLKRMPGSGNYPMNDYEELGGLSFEQVDYILGHIEHGTTPNPVIVPYDGIVKIEHLVKIAEKKRKIPYMLEG